MHSNNNILVIGDSIACRDILKNNLSGNYGIIEAKNGQDGLNKYKQYNENIVCVLLDIDMPVMDGFEFLHLKSAIDKNNDIPVIVTTTEYNKDHELTALKMGACDFIQKPYHPELLNLRINNAISKNHMSEFIQLKYLAEFDTLTGIHNKDKFFSNTKAMLAVHEKHDFSFFRADITRFSLVNSFFGIEMGDRLLKHFADTISAIVADYPFATYGRIEDDIFCFCIPTGNSDDIQKCVQKCKDSLADFDLGMDIMLNFGVYIIENHYMPVHSMFDCATLASKVCKGNYIVNYALYNSDMSKRLAKEQKIVNNMNYALSDNQFCVYFQPKYNLKNNKITGAEALVRWIHPTQGIIMPNDFIPVFEHNGFISKLDYYVWEHVCKYMSEWLASGYPLLPVSINVSRINLYSSKIVEILCDLTSKYNIPNDLLHLEITETAYMEDHDAMIKVIDELHRNGFIILMDDFGSGYSSLNVLKNLDFDILKLDMHFLSDKDASEKSRKILQTVVNLADALDIPTVAEGVETTEQADMLCSLGCDFAQGYLFSRPIPEPEYRKLLTNA